MYFIIAIIEVDSNSWNDWGQYRWCEKFSERIMLQLSLKDCLASPKSKMVIIVPGRGYDLGKHLNKNSRM